MNGDEDFDAGFDLRSDTPEGKDPDTYSPTLRRYHRMLWSKELPSGVPHSGVTHGGRARRC